MGYGRQCKELMAKGIGHILSQASDNIIVTSYEQLNNKEAERLRRSLHGIHGRLLVVKKSIARFALQGQSKDELKGLLKDLAPRKTLAFALGVEPVGLCKTISDFKKEHEGFFMEKGILDGQLVNSGRIAEIARLPSKEILQAQVTWGIKSPVCNLVNLLSGIMKKLAWALIAIREAKHDSRD